MIDAFSNLPPGTIASDFREREVCARCQCEIEGPIYMLADAPLLEAVVCQDCAYWHREKREQAAEGESEPTRVVMALLMLSGVLALVWDELKGLVRRVRR